MADIAREIRVQAHGKTPPPRGGDGGFFTASEKLD